MLVVTRREGEKIVIGDPANPVAVVEVVSVWGERVRVGVEADRSIPVHREETARKIKAKAPPLVRLGQGDYTRDIIA